MMNGGPMGPADQEFIDRCNNAKIAHGVTVVINPDNNVVCMLVTLLDGSDVLCGWTPGHARVVSYGLMHAADSLEPPAQADGGKKSDGRGEEGGPREGTASTSG